MGHVAVPELPWALVAGAGATRHVAAPELPCARRRESWDTQTCASVLSFIFELELVHGVPGLENTDKFVIWILDTLLGQSLILLFALALFFGIFDVAKVVVKLILCSELPHILTVCYKLWRFTLCDKSFPVFFFQVFELLEEVLLFFLDTSQVCFCSPSMSERCPS
jgi:hypothetical protein